LQFALISSTIMKSCIFTLAVAAVFLSGEAVQAASLRGIAGQFEDQIAVALGGHNKQDCVNDCMTWWASKDVCKDCCTQGKDRTGKWTCDAKKDIGESCDRSCSKDKDCQTGGLVTCGQCNLTGGTNHYKKCIKSDGGDETPEPTPAPSPAPWRYPGNRGGRCARSCKKDKDCTTGGVVPCATCNKIEGTQGYNTCIDPPSDNGETPEPTPAPSESESDSCLDDTEPKAKRDGSKYKFELKKSDAKCLDKENNEYQYGEFKDVKTDSECANRCVEDSKSNVLGNLEGFDLSCKKQRCRCLFDAGTLNSNKAEPYDAYDLNHDGTGKVKGTKEKDDTYCFKLKDVKFVGMDGEFDDEDDGDYEMESQ